MCKALGAGASARPTTRFAAWMGRQRERERERERKSQEIRRFGERSRHWACLNAFRLDFISSYPPLHVRNRLFCLHPLSTAPNPGHFDEELFFGGDTGKSSV